MLLLIQQVRLTEDEQPRVRGEAAADTYEAYRAWLSGAGDWSLHDVTLAQGSGATDLQIMASKREPSLEGATLGLDRLFDGVPVGQVVAVSLQVLDEPPAADQRAYPTPVRKCSICRYPDGLHAADCPRR